MKDYNHEIKVMNDLCYRYTNIKCHGGYGNNPSVTMLTNTSYIHEGFIKEVDVNYIGTDENGDKKYDNYLIIDSEYGHEIRLPYDKIIGMTILSSSEQADLEMCIRREDRWKKEIIDLTEMSKSDEVNDEVLKICNQMIEITEKALLKKDELIDRGVMTYK